MCLVLLVFLASGFQVTEWGLPFCPSSGAKKRRRRRGEYEKEKDEVEEEERRGRMGRLRRRTVGERGGIRRRSMIHDPTHSTHTHTLTHVCVHVYVCVCVCARTVSFHIYIMRTELFANRLKRDI